MRKEYQRLMRKQTHNYHSRDNNDNNNYSNTENNNNTHKTTNDSNSISNSDGDSNSLKKKAIYQPGLIICIEGLKEDLKKLDIRVIDII